jgi:hypothetical protein
LTFCKGHETIGASTGKGFDVAIGPSNLDAIGLCNVSKSEVKPDIVVGDITGAASHFLHKPMTSSENCNLGSDAIAIRRCAPCGYAQPMIFISGLVHQKQGPAVHVVDNGRDPAVIPQIANCQAPT